MKRSANKSKKVMRFGQPSWRMKSRSVEAFVTETGGQVGPVTFDLGGRKVAPFSIAPWAEEKTSPSMPPILKALRGDFFCMPFGGNATPYRGERHPLHGETANRMWKFESLMTDGERTMLRLNLDTKIRRGHVAKEISLVDGHRAVYSRHTVSRMSGPMSVGHHAMLRFPDEPGAGIVSTSRFTSGQVFVEPLERPENGGYSMLKPGAEFASLERVPTITGEMADVSRYPARRGYEDLVMMVSDDTAPFAWTAVSFLRERFIWIALKDPRVLRQTILWISNGGRHYAPWSGRHVNVMGLEEVTGYFHPGLAESARPNPLSRRGVPTTITLNPKRPLVVNYIMAVAPVPAGFGRVESVEADPRGGGIVVRSSSSKSVRVPIDLNFLSGAS